MGRNIAMMTVALFYPGNTIEIALGTGPGRYLLLAAGLWRSRGVDQHGLWLSRSIIRLAG